MTPNRDITSTSSRDRNQRRYRAVLVWHKHCTTVYSHLDLYVIHDWRLLESDGQVKRQVLEQRGIERVNPGCDQQRRRQRLVSHDPLFFCPSPGRRRCGSTMVCLLLTLTSWTGWFRGGKALADVGFVCHRRSYPRLQVPDDRPSFWEHLYMCRYDFHACQYPGLWGGCVGRKMFE